MAKTKSKAKDQQQKKKGRTPRVTKIDEDMLLKIKNLAQAGCTKEEMIKYLGVSRGSFYGKIIQDPLVVDLIEKEAVTTNYLLRKKQLELALKHDNVPMLIHLGKHKLGQTDKTEITGDLNMNISTEERREKLSKLNIDELRLLKQIAEKITHVSS